jgi:hypothetical protein
VFARFRPREITWPVQAPDRFSRAIERDGLTFEIAGDDVDAALVRAISGGLGELLDLSCRIEPPGERARATSPAIRVDLADRAARSIKLASLVSQAERWALAHPSSREPHELDSNGDAPDRPKSAEREAKRPPESESGELRRAEAPRAESSASTAHPQDETTRGSDASERRTRTPWLFAAAGAVLALLAATAMRARRRAARRDA